MRADNLPSDDLKEEMLRLHKRIEELEGELNKVSNEPPESSKDLAQGEDTIGLSFHYVVAEKFKLDKQSVYSQDAFSWNEIFRSVAPAMMCEASEDQFRDVLNELIREKRAGLIELKVKHGEKLESLDVEQSTFDTVKVQLRALGLIDMSARTRSVTDTQVYWKLTPYGILL